MYHLSKNTSLDQYVAAINKHQILNRAQEMELARKYREESDLNAAHKLIIGNLRFVVKVSHEYKGYGLKLLDLIQEGNIGLMMAVKKFDPDKGYRLISYAVWWIRAYIQNYVMRSWSLIKMGTTQAQRKLFFKLRSERERAEKHLQDGERVDVKDIAERLNVQAREVTEMEMRMAAKDFSLDAQIQEGSRQSHLDLLDDVETDTEATVANKQEREFLRDTVNTAMGHLNIKEQYIVNHRLMTEEPKTLQQIGDYFSISRERARQIEGNVIRKIRGVLEQSGYVRHAAA